MSAEHIALAEQAPGRRSALVTGSACRVGPAVYHRLLARHRVVGSDVVPYTSSDVVASIADVMALRGALRYVSVVVHTAAVHPPHVGRVPEQDFWAVNVVATETLMREAAEAGVRRLVFACTTVLYGAGARAGAAAAWCDEYAVLAPTTIYRRTKLAAARVTERLSANRPLPATVLRMSRCFPEPAPLMAVYGSVGVSA